MNISIDQLPLPTTLQLLIHETNPAAHKVGAVEPALIAQREGLAWVGYPTSLCWTRGIFEFSAETTTFRRRWTPKSQHLAQVQQLLIAVLPLPNSTSATNL